MSRHSTLGIGGPVDVLAFPGDVAACQAIFGYCHANNISCRALGGGSNLLVTDKGVRGVLVSTKNLRRLERAGNRVTVGAGVTTGKLLLATLQWELGGVEFLAGVPGTVGGGMVMNAGTYLGEFKDVTVQVTSVRADGTVVRRDNAACKFVYRGSALPEGEAVVEAELLLEPRPRAEMDVDVLRLRTHRKTREPKAVRNAGSIFKNPPNDYAGRLIEAAGLKGRSRGGAQVSPVHANWLVNTGGATATELLELIEEVRAAVLAKFGVRLELEVKVVGES